MSVIEALVAITIFSFMTMIAMSVLTTISRSQKKTTIANDVYGSAQEMMDNIVQITKQSNDTLTSVGPQGNQQACVNSCLALLQPDGSTVIFTLVNKQLLMLKSDLNDPSPTRLSSPNVNVDNLTFTINRPAINPPPPSVSIGLDVSAITSDPKHPQLSASTHLQNVIVLRNY